MTNDEMPDNLPDVIWVRRFNNKPTGIEIVFGEVDNPMFKYHRAQPPIEGLREAIDAIEYYNEWRRGADTEQPNPTELGKNIEIVLQAAKREMERQEK